MSEKNEVVIETFAAYLRRKTAFAFKPKEPKESWNSRNRGLGIPAWSGRNVQKRAQREAHQVDRLAQIRFARSPFGGNSIAHVPKTKHIDPAVFA